MRFDSAYLRHAIGNRAPRWPFSLNRSNVQASGLVHAFTAIGPRKVIDLAARRNVTTIGGPTWRASAAIQARSAFTNGADDGFALGDVTLDDFTMIWRGIPRDVGQQSGQQDALFAFEDFGETDITAGRDAVNLKQKRNLSASSGTIEAHINGTGGLVDNIGLSQDALNVVAVTRQGTTVTVYVNSVQKATIAVGSGTGRVLQFGRLGCHRFSGSNQEFADADHIDFLIFDRVLPVRAIESFYHPRSRWDLYRARRVPRAWPIGGGGAVTRTLSGSLDAAARRQIAASTFFDAGVSADIARAATADAALRAVRDAQVAFDAALERARSEQVTADGVIRAAHTLSGAAEAALAKATELAASLDASVAGSGVGLRGAALDAAVERLLTLVMALDAALARLRALQASLDAGLAVRGLTLAALDGVVERLDSLAGLALEAAVRHSVDLSAVLDAVIGAVVTPGAGRIFHVPARDGHAVAGDLRTLVIPGGNRRH